MSRLYFTKAEREARLKWLKLTAATRSISPVTIKLLTGSMKSKACQCKRSVVDENLLPSKSRSTKTLWASYEKGSSGLSPKKSQPKPDLPSELILAVIHFLKPALSTKPHDKTCLTTSYHWWDERGPLLSEYITLFRSTPKASPYSATPTRPSRKPRTISGTYTNRTPTGRGSTGIWTKSNYGWSLQPPEICPL